MAEWNRDEIEWRQGLLLPEDAVEALRLHHPESPEKTVVIVATHDCDLAQAPQREPDIEVVIGRFVPEKDGNNTHAKNARKLHIEFSGGNSFWAEFEAIAKVKVSKLELSRFMPRSEAVLSPECHAVFQIWLASRYRRSAFSDEFERRLTSKDSKLHEVIAKAVKPHGEHISGVFFDVDEGLEVSRNGADDTYTLDIIILHSAEPDFDASENAAKSAATSIAKEFKTKLFDPTKSWKNIELRSCECVSESVLTYHEFKRLKRWRLEHLSLGAEPQQPAIAE